MRAVWSTISVIDLASALDLPVGVVHIPVADVAERALVAIHNPSHAPYTDIRLLQDVLDDLWRLLSRSARDCPVRRPGLA